MDNGEAGLFELLKKQCETNLAIKPPEKIISAESQQDEIQKLKNNIWKEQFFFTLNLAEFEIENLFGIEIWLGQSIKNITFEKFHQLIHPSHLLAYEIILYNIYLLLLEPQECPAFLTERFIIIFALKGYDGNYLLVKNTCSPFQYNVNGGVIEYLHEFTVIGNFNGEPAVFRTIGGNAKPVYHEQELLKRIKAGFEALRIFSIQELRILKMYALEEYASYDELLDQFKIKRTTVNTYNKRILLKASGAFGRKFLSARQIALFIKAQGLISLM